jgi:hypothetical protein
MRAGSSRCNQDPHLTKNFGKRAYAEPARDSVTRAVAERAQSLERAVDQLPACARSASIPAISNRRASLSTPGIGALSNRKGGAISGSRRAVTRTTEIPTSMSWPSSSSESYFLVNGATPARDSALASSGGELHFESLTIALAQPGKVRHDAPMVNATTGETFPLPLTGQSPKPQARLRG